MSDPTPPNRPTWRQRLAPYAEEILSVLLLLALLILPALFR